MYNVANPHQTDNSVHLDNSKNMTYEYSLSGEDTQKGASMFKFVN